MRIFANELSDVEFAFSKRGAGYARGLSIDEDKRVIVQEVLRAFKEGRGTSAKQETDRLLAFLKMAEIRPGATHENTPRA